MSYKQIVKKDEKNYDIVDLSQSVNLDDIDTDIESWNLIKGLTAREVGFVVQMFHDPEFDIDVEIARLQKIKTDCKAVK